MPRHPTGSRKYNIGYLWDRHHEILRLNAIGLSHQGIATMLGITPQTVSNTVRSNISQPIIDEFRLNRDGSAVDVKRTIEKLAPEAVSKVRDIMRSADLKTSLAAAKDLLDRGGFAAPTKVDIRKMSMHVTAEDIERLKQRQIEKGVIVKANSKPPPERVEAEIVQQV